MPWFLYLEAYRKSIIISSNRQIDNYIPVEYFIVLYLLWFLFIAVTVGYFFLYGQMGFLSAVRILIHRELTFFLLICTFFPNGSNSRPVVFERNNIFVDLVKPHTHGYADQRAAKHIVFNSIGVSIAIAHSNALKKHRMVQCSAYLLAMLIIMSTVFLKQHSVTDVIAAIAMACIIYPFVYVTQEKKAPKLSHQPI